MNAHIITLYVLIGVLILALAFIIYKSFAVESKLRHVLTFINGEVFSERFQEVIRIFIEEERKGCSGVASTTARPTNEEDDDRAKTNPQAAIQPSHAEPTNPEPTTPEPATADPTTPEPATQDPTDCNATQLCRVPKLTEHVRDNIQESLYTRRETQ